MLLNLPCCVHSDVILILFAVCDYYIMLFTGSESTAHSNRQTEIEILLSGENGDSGWRQLRKKTVTQRFCDDLKSSQPGFQIRLELELTNLKKRGNLVQFIANNHITKYDFTAVKIRIIQMAQAQCNIGVTLDKQSSFQFSTSC